VQRFQIESALDELAMALLGTVVQHLMPAALSLAVLLGNSSVAWGQSPPKERLSRLETRRSELAAELKAVDDSISALRAAVPPAVFTDTVFYTEAMPSLMQPKMRIFGLDETFHDTPYWIVESPNGKRHYFSMGSVKVQNEIAALLFFRGRARPSGPLLVGVLTPDYPNSVGGVDVEFAVKNLDPRRTIKYLTLTVVPYNAVGDAVRSSIDGKSAVRLRYTGPLASGKTESYAGWSTVWYNATISCVELRRMEVEYMDGSRYTYVRELPSVVTPAVRLRCGVRR
jgi:hypothetical protein